MRYYYDCPLKAAWMAKYFGMKIYWSSEDGWQITHLIHHSIEGKKTDIKLYVHKDSLNLLDPQSGDLICFGGETYGKYYAPVSLDNGINVNGIRIIQRDNIPFMWPEIEE